MILSAFRGPGAHFGSPGTHFEDISDFHDFEDASGAKKPSTFEVKMRSLTHSVQCCVLDVFFECSLFVFFCDFETCKSLNKYVFL